MLKKIEEATSYIKTKIDKEPLLGLILGTGLNSLSDMLQNPIVIEYKDIPHFKESTAPSHTGKLVFGELHGKFVMFMQGRLHYYEGYTMQEITFPVRVMKALGVKYLIVTNAAGSLNENMQPGDVIMLHNHINFMGDSPLRGKNYPELGERFPSMHEPYDKHLMDLTLKIAVKENFIIKKGVYIAVAGPNLETKSESLMLAGFGADLVGMSTVPEVIVAVHSGIKVLGFSVVTNLSNIFHSQPHSQEEIRKNALKAKNILQTIILKIIEKI